MSTDEQISETMSTDEQISETMSTVVNSTISLQKEYAQKVGIVTTMPQNTVKVITGTTHEFVKSNSIQNQMVLTTIDAIQQIIKTFNENVKSYVDLNKNTLKSWFFSFTTKNN